MQWAAVYAVPNLAEDRDMRRKRHDATVAGPTRLGY